MNKTRVSTKREIIKKSQAEMLALRNITELKNSLEEFNCRLDQAEESVNSNTGPVKLSGQRKRKVKEKFKNEESKERLKDLVTTLKRTNIHILTVPEGERKEQRAYLRKKEQKLPDLRKEMKIQIQEV